MKRFKSFPIGEFKYCYELSIDELKYIIKHRKIRAKSEKAWHKYIKRKYTKIGSTYFGIMKNKRA